MNISGMIGRLHGKNFTVTRQSAAGTYSPTDGTYSEGATQTLTVLGSLQPMTPEDLDSIPEGDRTKERYRFYSLSALKNADPVTLKKSDLIDVDGVAFSVERVEHWPTHGKAIIVKVNTDAN